MKILLILVLSMALQSQAGVYNRGQVQAPCGGPPGTVNECGSNGPAKLGPLQRYVTGQVISMSPLCPEIGICLVDGTHVELEFLVQSSCSGYLEPLTFSVSPESSEVEVTAIFTRHGGDKICPAVMETVYRSIDLIDVYLPLTLSFKTDDAAYATK